MARTLVRTFTNLSKKSWRKCGFVHTAAQMDGSNNSGISYIGVISGL